MADSKAIGNWFLFGSVFSKLLSGLK